MKVVSLKTVFLLLASKVLPVMSFIGSSSITRSRNAAPLCNVAQHVEIQCNSNDLGICPLPQSKLMDGRFLMERLQQHSSSPANKHSAFDVGSSEVIVTNTNTAYYEKDISSIRESLTKDSERNYQLQAMERDLGVAQLFADKDNLHMMKYSFREAEKHAKAAHVNNAAFYDRTLTIQHSFGKKSV